MKTLLLTTAAALVAAAPAVAQEGDVHLGAGYTFLDTDGAEFDAVTVRGGYDFTDYLGVEGEALIGLNDESYTVAGVPIEASVDYGLGAFAKAQYPLADQVSVFARLGYVYYEAEVRGLGAAPQSVADSEGGVGYGVGAEWAFAGPNAVRADWTRNDFDDGETDAYTLSYVRRF